MFSTSTYTTENQLPPSFIEHRLDDITSRGSSLEITIQPSLFSPLLISTLLDSITSLPSSTLHNNFASISSFSTVQHHESSILLIHSPSPQGLDSIISAGSRLVNNNTSLSQRGLLVHITQHKDPSLHFSDHYFCSLFSLSTFLIAHLDTSHYPLHHFPPSKSHHLYPAQKHQILHLSFTSPHLPYTQNKADTLLESLTETPTSTKTFA
jgi:hypothetical protein